MSRRSRPVLAVVASAAVLLAACGGGGSGRQAATTSSTTTPATTPAAGGDTGGAGSSTTSPASGPPPGRVTTTTGARAGAGAPGTTAPGGPATTAGPAPVPAGTYSYRQSGVSGPGAGARVPARGTVAVDAARPDGTQTFRRVIEPSSPQDYVFAFRPDGLFLLSTDQTFGGTRVHCDFSPPVPAPPWPPAAGRSFSGRGQCSGFTVEVEGRVTGEREVQLDGAVVRVVVVESTVVTRGQVESSGRQVDWFSPDLRLVVHEEMRREGRFGSFPFVVDVTSDLESARPS